MKKLPKLISVYLTPVQLFIDDVELIEEVYKSNCDSYQIRTDESEFDCVEDLKKIDTKKIFFLEFKSPNPYINLTIESENVKIYSFKDDVISIGIVSKLKDLLEPRSNLLIHFSKKLSWFLVGTILIIPYFMLQDFVKSNQNLLYILILIQLFLLVIDIFIVKNITLKMPVLYIKTRIEKTNFLLENKNQIILLFMGGLITFIVQLLVQWFKQSIFGVL